MLDGVSAFPRSCLPLSPHMCLCWMVCPPSRSLDSPYPPLSPIVSRCGTRVHVLEGAFAFPGLGPHCLPAYVCLCWMVCSPSRGVPVLDGVSAFPSSCLPLSPIVSPNVCTCWMMRPPFRGLVSPCLSRIVSLLVFFCWLPEVLSPFLFPFVGWFVRSDLPLSPIVSHYLRTCVPVLYGASAFLRSCLPLCPHMCARVGWCVRLPKVLSTLVSHCLRKGGLCCVSAFPRSASSCFPLSARMCACVGSRVRLPEGGTMKPAGKQASKPASQPGRQLAPYCPGTAARVTVIPVTQVGTAFLGACAKESIPF